MSARDLAATVRGALKQGILHMDEPRDALAALAVLEQQAADARGLRYSKQSWVEMGKLERLRADAAEGRAVCAEEALRQIADSYGWIPYANDECVDLSVELARRDRDLKIPTNRRIAREALAAAGADTGQET